jgi:hypothetical protein
MILVTHAVVTPSLKYKNILSLDAAMPEPAGASSAEAVAAGISAIRNSAKIKSLAGFKDLSLD